MFALIQLNYGSDHVLCHSQYSIPGVRVMVAPHLRHHHPPHLAHLAQQDHPQEAV